MQQLSKIIPHKILYFSYHNLGFSISEENKKRTFKEFNTEIILIINLNDSEILFLIYNNYKIQQLCNMLP